MPAFPQSILVATPTKKHNAVLQIQHYALSSWTDQTMMKKPINPSHCLGQNLIQ
jgi:hypothetical protein